MSGVFRRKIFLSCVFARLFTLSTQLQVTDIMYQESLLPYLLTTNSIEVHKASPTVSYKNTHSYYDLSALKAMNSELGKLVFLLNAKFV